MKITINEIKKIVRNIIMEVEGNTFDMTFDQKMKAAQDPNTKPETLEGLSMYRNDREGGESFKIRAWVARNPNINRRTFEVLSEDPVPFVREFIASHVKCPNDILKKLLNDRDPRVKQHAERNPNAWMASRS